MHNNIKIISMENKFITQTEALKYLFSHNVKDGIELTDKHYSVYKHKWTKGTLSQKKATEILLWAGFEQEELPKKELMYKLVK